jgi:Flp pilus assembly protein TadG
MQRSKLAERLRAFRIISDDGGQVLILSAVCMAVIFGFLALAIDVGQLQYAKRSLQMVADAAALAAGLEIRVCGTLTNCPAMQTAAQSALVENGYSGSTFVTHCGTVAATGLTLVLNSPPCALGTADPNTGKTNYVEVVLSKPQPTYFARVLGYSSVVIRARAESAHILGGPCIYALDPTGSGAIAITAGLGFKSTCAMVDESSSSSALTCLIGLVSAPRISVTGGTSGLLCGSAPAPITGVPVPSPADPLAYLPAPPRATDPCPTVATGSPYSGSPKAVTILVGLGSNIVFNPGVYCGGISITAGLLTSVTFNPGIYILKDGPGPLGALVPSSGLTITVSALSSVTGTGVTFYNSGTSGSFSITVPAALGLTTFNLSAPTSGQYGGVLFFQAHGDTATGTFLVSLLQGSKLQGAIYMPDAQVSYGVTAVAASYNILVAKDIQFTAPILSTFGSDYSTLVNGSPINGDTAALVQ